MSIKKLILVFSALFLFTCIVVAQDQTKTKPSSMSPSSKRRLHPARRCLHHIVPFATERMERVEALQRPLSRLPPPTLRC